MSDRFNFQVADLVVDPGRGRVARGDTEIPLPKLSFDLLLVLTREAPNLLSVDALIDKVWPGLVVSPETVSQRVKLLRDALGDDPKSPRYIGSLRGRGYQLIAPVQRLAVDPAPAPVVAIAPTPTLDSIPSTAKAATTAPLAESKDERPAATSAVCEASQQAAIELPAATAGQPPLPNTSPRQVLRARAVKFAAAAACVVLLALIVLLVRELWSPDFPATADFSPPPHSVAVLAFVNMSGDEKMNYLSDGLAEELSTALARVEPLRVAARTSAFAFKGKQVDIQTVARQLNVGAVLEGSVRVSDDRLRITVQLINALTGFHLWTQTYDRDSRDLLSLQQEIATAVAGALKIKLLASDESKLMPGATRNADAYDAYLRGRYGETVEDEPNLRAALAAQEQALALDPQYADALAARADVAAQIGNMFTPNAHDREQLYTKAIESAQQAVALAPESGWAYSILGQTLANVKGDFKAADVAYRKSIELEPGNADVLHAYASFAASFGRADAINVARRAVQLDPLGLGSWGNLALTLYFAHRFDEAAAAFNESARLGYNHVNASWAGLNELAAGRPESAAKACEADVEFWYNQLCLALVYHKLGRQKDAQAMLDKIKASQGDQLAIEYAEIYAYWGDKPAALKALRRAVEIGDPGLLSVNTDPFLDSLHDSPEFKAIVARLDLPT